MIQPQIYAWNTIITVGMAYALFAAVSCLRGKWYYAVFHPYVFVCFVMLMAYRYVSEVSYISAHVDRIAAVGFLWASLIFWGGYLIVKEKHIEWLLAMFGRPSTEETEDVGTRKLWAMTIFLLVLLLGYMVVMYVKCGSLEFLIATGYKKEYSSKIVSGEFAMESLWFKGSQYVFRNTIWVLIYVAVALLFEALRKRKKAHGGTATTVVVFSILLICTLVPLSIGSRGILVCILGAVVLLTAVSFLFPSRRLSRMAIPILLLFMLNSLFWMLTIQSVRYHGFVATFAGPHSVFSKFGMKKTMTSMSGTVEKQVVPQSLAEKNTDIAKDDPDLFSLHLGWEGPIVNDEKKNNGQGLVQKARIDEVMNEEETKPSSVATAESKDKPDETHESRPKTMAVEPRKKNQSLETLEVEKTFLKSYRFSHSKSKEMAWVMLWFSRHRDFLGFSYQLKNIVYYFFPLYNKAEDRMIPIGQIVLTDRGIEEVSATLVGPFGEGYACYGYVGGFFYWGLYALLGGVFAKFSVRTLYTASPRLELTALSLGLQMHIFVMMTSHISTTIRFLNGYIVFLVLWLVIFRMIRKRTDTDCLSLPNDS